MGTVHNYESFTTRNPKGNARSLLRALRYFEDSTDDGSSIGHADD
ncbi:MAG: hypothetical protein P8Y45_16105 [Exilibacterium sp.]